jgi:hypothetical protein
MSSSAVLEQSNRRPGSESKIVGNLQVIGVAELIEITSALSVIRPLSASRFSPVCSGIMVL